MQRLLDDASKISGIQYDISSFADITDAIHVMQEEMGIAGATALEAGTTIQGSIGAMQGAWTNLITGLADGSVDIGQLVDSLVTTIVGDGTEENLGVFGNILPAVQTALTGASTLVSELLPQIVQIIPTIITENLPILAEAAISIVQALVDGISQNQEMLMTTAFDTIAFLANSLISMLPQIVALGLDLIVSLANGIAESLPELIPTIIDVVLQIVDTLTNPDSVSKLLVAAAKIIGAVTIGLIEAVPDLVIKIPEIISSIVDGFDDAMPDIIEVGKNIVEGLWEGIKSLSGWIGKKATGFFDGLFDDVKENEEIHSPSKKWAYIGKNMALGLGEGWEDEFGSIKKGIENGMDFGVANIDVGASMLGRNSNALNSAFSNFAAKFEQNATIVVQSVLDGKVIGETAFQYSKNRERAYGGA